MFVACVQHDCAIITIRNSFNVAVTEAGTFIDDGSAARYHEWVLRVGVRMAAVKDDDKAKHISQIVDALRGGAALVALDLGTEALLESDGLEKLATALRDNVSPQARAEAKELYRTGHKKHGHLARQHNEPMVSYVSRRRRWWELLQKLDSTIKLWDSILGDLLLEASGLTADQQPMVLTSTQNKREFEVIAAALLEQHAKTHLSDRKTQREAHRKTKKNEPWIRTANLGAEWDNDDSDDLDDGSY